MTGEGTLALTGRLRKRSDVNSNNDNRQQFDIANYIEPHEMQALRKNNPHNKAFESHLGKVLSSVQHRKKYQGMHSIAHY
jgi:hypothetical protein